MIANASEQALGSATTVAIETSELPSFSDVKIDPVTTIAGGGGLVAKGIANPTMKPFIGTTPLSQAGAPTAAGVDTHLETHVAVLINNLGQVIDTDEFSVCTIGYGKLLKWSRSVLNYVIGN